MTLIRTGLLVGLLAIVGCGSSKPTAAVPADQPTVEPPKNAAGKVVIPTQPTSVQSP